MPSSADARSSPATKHVDILQSLSSGVIALDSAGRVITANSAARGHLNLPPESLPDGVDFHSIEGAAQFQEIIEEVRHTGGAISRREVTIQTPQGRKVIGVSASPIQGEIGYNGVIFLFVDLTEVQALKRAAELNRQLAQIGELTAGVVHELRNPLSVISGMSELLIRKLGDGHEDLDKVKAIFEEANQLESLIAHFLSFARPYEVETVPCSAEEILNRAVFLCKRLASERGVELKVNAPSTAPVLYADEGKVALALSNIIRNAVEAVARGGKVWIALEASNADVVYRVEDNGPGIHLSEGEDLFRAFLTKKEGGTGLGLAIVHRMITAHGGRVTYGNRDAGGACFEVSLPKGSRA